MGCGLCVQGSLRLTSTRRAHHQAGHIFHWTDNEGVCTVMAKSDRALGVSGVKVSYRDLWWGEIKGVEDPGDELSLIIYIIITIGGPTHLGSGRAHNLRCHRAHQR